MKPDASNIGADKSTQDPQEAIEQASGAYVDIALQKPLTETIDYLPKGPDPTPFVIKKAAGG